MILSPEKIIHQLWRFLISNPILIENSQDLFGLSVQLFRVWDHPAELE